MKTQQTGRGIMDDLTDPMPERIRVWKNGEENGYGYGSWSEEDCPSDGVYLISRPVLEHAEEMKTRLRKLVIAVKKEMNTSHFVKTCDCHMCKEYRKAKVFLATIEAEEKQ